MCNREKEGGIPGKLPVGRKLEWYKSEQHVSKMADGFFCLECKKL